MASNNKTFLKGLLLLVVCVLLSYTIGVVIGGTVNSKQAKIVELQEQLTKCEQEHGLCIWQAEGILSENRELWELNIKCQEAVVALEMENYACLWLLEQLWRGE